MANLLSHENVTDFPSQVPDEEEVEEEAPKAISFPLKIRLCDNANSWKIFVNTQVQETPPWDSVFLGIAH